MLKRTLCAAFAVAVLVAFSVPAFAGSHHKMRVRGTVESDLAHALVGGLLRPLLQRRRAP